jgi:hypothetical protein
VAFGYLPSWCSPKIRIQVDPSTNDAGLVDLMISGSRVSPLRHPLMRRVLGRLVRAAPLLDLWPVLPMLSMSAPAKSYHFGSSFPHSLTARAGLQSDLLGRVHPWRRIHAIDGSVLPSIAATTFTMTVMANAHRIATEVLAEGV